VIYSEKIKGHW